MIGPYDGPKSTVAFAIPVYIRAPEMLGFWGTAFDEKSVESLPRKISHWHFSQNNTKGEYVNLGVTWG